MNTTDPDPQYDAIADVYDPVWGDDRSTADSFSYTTIASQSDGPILEMGSGTGRVCIDLAAIGHQVVGLELSPKMAAIATAKARERLDGVKRAKLEIIINDMCTFDSPARFGLVILPFSALWECGSKEHVQKALSNAYRLLANAGTLFFDCSYYGAGGRQQRPPGEIHSPRRRACGENGTLTFREADWFDEGSGLTEKWLYIDREDARGIVVERRTHCIQRIYLTPDQIRTALNRAGFHSNACELSGSFDLRTPLDDDSFRDPNHQNFRKARQVWICRKGNP